MVRYPNNPTIGDMILDANGDTHIFDGTRWGNVSSFEHPWENFVKHLYTLFGVQATFARKDKLKTLLGMLPEAILLDLVSHSSMTITLIENPSPELLRVHKIKWEI